MSDTANLNRVDKKRGVSLTERAGLTFPVARVSRYMRKGNYAKRLGIDAAVFLTASMEYLVAELLEVAAKTAGEHRRVRISPRHVRLAIDRDRDLSVLMKNVTLANGGELQSVRRRNESLKKKKAKVHAAANKTRVGKLSRKAGQSPVGTSDGDGTQLRASEMEVDEHCVVVVEQQKIQIVKEMAQVVAENIARSRV